MGSPKSAIRAALTTKLQSFVPVYPISWEGKTYDPIPGQAHLIPFLMPGKPRAAGCGDAAPNQHTGIYQIMVVFPSDNGVGDVNACCDALVNHFKRGTLINTAEGVLTVTRSWSGNEMPTTDWISIPVSVTYSLFAAN